MQNIASQKADQQGYAPVQKRQSDKVA